MKKWLLYFILVLQVGCTSFVDYSNLEPPSKITLSNWQQLESVLADAPHNLQQEIILDAESRLRSISPVNESTGLVTETSRQTLIDILNYTRNPVLLADDNFIAIHDLINGNQTLTAQAFASVLADSLTQSQFQCQQPIYWRYLQQRYLWNTVTSPCRPEVPFRVSSRHEGSQVLWLNPQQVSEIHLLFGGNGQNMASRFGHVALRLIICPEGQKTETACNLNVFGHVVIGFMAHIDEFELDTFKAFLGNYKAYLFASPFMDVYQNYAITEFRDVYSLPLKLKRQQREQMVRELSELHWRFSSDYNFFTENCASLLQQSLRVLLPDFNQDKDLASNYIRPDHFFSAVRKSNLAEDSKLALLEQAEKEGYFFSSTKPFYDKALKVVEKSMVQPAFNDIQDYLAVNPVERMQNIIDDEEYYQILSQDEYVFQAQVMLEELAVARYERHFLAEGACYFHEQGFSEGTNTIYSQLNNQQQQLFKACFLQPVKQISEPRKQLNRIPDEEALPKLIKPSSVCFTPEGRAELRVILESINSSNLDQWQRVVTAAHLWEASINNVMFLYEIVN